VIDLPGEPKQTLRINFNLSPIVRILYLSALTLFALSGCSRYEEGFKAGYSQGSADAETRVRADYEQRLAVLESEASSKSSASYSATVQTEVCGGSGVNLNGKHYSGGKTGCVRVLSDGRVERY